MNTQLNTQWQQRSAYERQLILLAIWLVVMGGGYLGGWQPLSKQATQLTKQIHSLQTDLDWMSQTSPKIMAKNPAAAQSLLSVVDKTARQAALERFIKRLEPDTENRVRLWLEQVEFATLMQWLSALKSQQIQVFSINLQRQEAAGIVNATLILSTGAGG